jgi:hypothetical protein
MEVHFIAEDGIYCLLDMARCFPPEHSLVVMSEKDGVVYGANDVWFRMLRPELLTKLRGTGMYEPISPDSLTGWGRSEAELHEERVKMATEFLMGTSIPQLSDYFFNVNVDEVDISELFHRYGVNMRHIGLVFCSVRKQMESSAQTAYQFIVGDQLDPNFWHNTDNYIPRHKRADLRDMNSSSQKILERLYEEFTSRTIKNLLRRFLRGEESSFMSLDTFCTYLWTSEGRKRIDSEGCTRYGAIIPGSLKDNNIVFKDAFINAAARCGIVIASSSDVFTKHLETEVSFQMNDFSDFTCSIKKLPQLDIIQGKMHMEMSNRMEQANLIADCGGYRRSAMISFNIALKGFADFEKLRVALGRCCLDLIKVETVPERFLKTFYFTMRLCRDFSFPSIEQIFESVLDSIVENCPSDIFLQRMIDQILYKYPKRSPLSFLGVCKLVCLGIRVSEATLSFYCDGLTLSLVQSAHSKDNFSFLGGWVQSFTRKWLHLYHLVLLEVVAKGATEVPIAHLKRIRDQLQAQLIPKDKDFRNLPYIEQLLLTLNKISSFIFMHEDDPDKVEHALRLLEFLSKPIDVEKTLLADDWHHVTYLMKYFKVSSVWNLLFRAHFPLRESSPKFKLTGWVRLLRDYALSLFAPKTASTILSSGLGDVLVISPQDL